VGLPTPRLLPGFLLAVTVVSELAAVPLSWGLEPAYDTLLYAVFSCALAGTGALILTRHPRHAIGWLLSGLGVANALTGDLAEGWRLRAAVEGWPGGTVAELIAGASWLPQAALFVMILLLFPTGHLPGRRWSLVAWLSVLGVVLCGPGALDADPPYAVDGLPTPFAVGITLIAVVMLAALVAALRRFRSSTGVLRQQMKWFALSSSFLVLTLIPTAMLWGASPLLPVLSAVALTLWPVAIGAAILRYRLYDVDLVISRTFTYLTLTILLGLVYAGTVVVIGTFAGQGSPWATAGATLLAAAAFKLLHRRVQERVDDRFLPARQDALRSVAAFLERLRADQAEPEQVEDVLRSSLDDPGLELWFVLQGDDPPVDARGRPVTARPHDTESFAVERGGVTLGQVVWRPRTGQQRAMLPSVVAAAGLAIDMARLRVELRRRLEDVEASRARIASVADEERRRIERDLHDGAQQRLVSIGLTLRHAQHQLGSDDDGARQTLDGAVAEVAAAIDELRELAHGLRPALLEAGLGAALRDLASRAPVPVDVAATGARYPPDVEAAAYFVACEGLTNAVKHAGAEHIQLQVARHDGSLVVSVADDGVGGAAVGGGSGLTGLSDRVAARGGHLYVDSVLGRGTKLIAELPCVS
jgi:signal transduction histidine kinase